MVGLRTINVAVVMGVDTGTYVVNPTMASMSLIFIIRSNIYCFRWIPDAEYVGVLVSLNVFERLVGT